MRAMDPSMLQILVLLGGVLIPAATLPAPFLTNLRESSQFLLYVGVFVEACISLWYVLLHPTTDAHRDAVRSGGLKQLRRYVKENPGLLNYYSHPWPWARRSTALAAACFQGNLEGVRFLLTELSPKLRGQLDLSKGYQDPLNFSARHFPFICLTQTPLDQALKQYYSPSLVEERRRDYEEIVMLLLKNNAPTSPPFARLARRFQSDRLNTKGPIPGMFADSESPKTEHQLQLTRSPPIGNALNQSSPFKPTQLSLQASCRNFTAFLNALPKEEDLMKRCIQSVMSQGIIPCGDGINYLWDNTKAFSSFSYVEREMVSSVLDHFPRQAQADEPTPPLSASFILTALFEMDELAPLVSDWRDVDLEKVVNAPGYENLSPHQQMDLLYVQRMLWDPAIPPPYWDHFQQCSLCRCQDPIQLIRYLHTLLLPEEGDDEELELILRWYQVNGRRFLVLLDWFQLHSPMGPRISFRAVQKHRMAEESHHVWEEVGPPLTDMSSCSAQPPHF